MDPIANPFAPGAGTKPPELVGRSEIVEEARIAFARIKQGLPARSSMLVGLRGVGKTVLLNKLNEMADDQGYKTQALEVPESRRLAEVLVPPLRSLLLRVDRTAAVSEQGRKALGVLRNFAAAFHVKFGEIELKIDPSPGQADSGDLESDLSELFLAVGLAAKDRGSAVGLFIDEMQYLSEADLAALVTAIHKTGQKQLPLLVVGAGLPQLVGLCGKAKSYTERLFNFPNIGPLSEFEAKQALTIPARDKNVLFEPEALAEIIRLTRCYPYFLQEWGFHSWNVATRSPITLGAVKKAYDPVLKQLDGSFFRVRFDRLTPREKDYLRAMAELGSGPHRSGDVANVLEVPVRTIAPIRGQLIKKGMVYSPAHGDTAFTVPLFDEFMKRSVPSLKRSKPVKHVTPELE